MSFSMNMIKRKTTSKQDYIKECHFVVKDMTILTENVKYGLWQYANYRFTKRNRGVFKGDTFRVMIYDLLEYCCNKSITEISLKDVNINENQILYEIKKAIYYGATRCLYDASNSIIDYNNIEFKQTLEEPKRLSKDNLNIEEVRDYFKDMVFLC